MSTNEFWNEEPKLLWAYRKVYADKIKIQNEMNNYNAWLNGLYVFDAMSKCLFNSFGRKETQSPEHYVPKPYNFNAKPKTKEELEQEERIRVEEQIKERNIKIKAMLNNRQEVE